MTGFRIQGNTSGNVLEVNADNEAKVALPSDETKAGYVLLSTMNDSGSITNVKNVMSLESSQDYRLRVGVDNVPLFSEYFPGTAINSALWTAPVTTMTVTVASGFATLNAGLSTAASAVARVSSYRSFPNYNKVPIYFETVLQFSQAPVTNNVSEFGLGIASGILAPTDGVFFRLLANGEFRGIVNTGGIETQTEPLDFNALVGEQMSKHFIITLNDDNALFYIDDVLVGSVARGDAGSGVVVSQNLPIFFRTYNTGVTTAAQTMKIGLVGITLGDTLTNKPWSHVRAASGDMGYQGPTGGTMGSTALYTNNLAPGAGVAATNTTAALGSGLGGQFSLLPTLTANTDGIIQSYQVPLGTALVPGKSLVITGVHITGMVTTALVGGPVLGFWSLAFGHTAVSLATTESATGKAPRRIPLGIQTWAATSAVGTKHDEKIQFVFDTPVIVQPGEFVQCVMKNVGTVTSAGVITFLITFDSHWE